VWGSYLSVVGVGNAEMIGTSIADVDDLIPQRLCPKVLQWTRLHYFKLKDPKLRHKYRFIRFTGAAIISPLA
jgi:hypothetical protein